jgi:competence protein ComEA
MRVHIALAVTVLGAVPALAQTQLPEGKGKAEMVRLCGTCHPPERGAAVRLTEDGWRDVIAKMVTLGMKGTDEELELVHGYVSTNFKGDAPKPINMNSASSIELESVAGFLRKEAATWIAYRSKKGPCKTLDDFKKVPGVDFKKVDQRRDRLVCF